MAESTSVVVGAGFDRYVSVPETPEADLGWTLPSPPHVVCRPLLTGVAAGVLDPRPATRVEDASR